MGSTNGVSEKNLNQKNKNMEDKSKTMWFDLIKSIGFSPKNHEKIYSYVKTHSSHELKHHELFKNEEIAVSTLPVALSVLRGLDEQGLLDKVYFVSEPNAEIILNDGSTKNSTTKVFNIKMELVDDVNDLYVTNELILSKISEYTLDGLKKILESNEVVIHLICSSITSKEKDISILHRYDIL